VTSPGLRQYLFLLFLPVVPAVLAGILLGRHQPLPPPQIPEIQLRQIAANETVLWVDARPEKSYRQAHIPNAWLLNEDAWQVNFPKLLKAWDKQQKLIVYCTNEYCRTAHRIAARIRSESLRKENIYVLRGGWEAYEKSPAR
jgi:rhodanese-related sulfurtransferase